MSKKIKFCLVLISSTFLFSSCSSWTRLGTLTMMSTRNVDSKTEYVELARYIDSESREAKNSLKNTSADKGKKLDLAVDRCVASVTGGEFMKNVQIYINGGEVKVIGDVWGKEKGFSLSPEQRRLKLEKDKILAQEKQQQLKKESQKNQAIAKRQNQIEANEKLVKAFTVGDKVTWSYSGKLRIGEIIGKDSETAIIKYLDKQNKEQILKVRYKALTIIP